MEEGEKREKGRGDGTFFVCALSLSRRRRRRLPSDFQH